MAGEARSDLAAAALASLLPHVVDDFSDRHGRVKGGALAIVALGKLGGREMLPGSDLDLVLIYDHDPAAEASQGGARAMPVTQYYARLANQVVAAITAPGPEGRLGEVDMRLRPSGSKGPVAVSLAAFTRYHQESAWTWERMALTRARVVAGPQGLARRINAAIRAALTREGVAAAALADATAMRARLARDKPAEGPWDVKLMAGGLVEVEFIAQSLQLAHAHRTPGVLATQTRSALAALARHKVLDAAEAQTLIAAEKLWRTVSGLLRLTIGNTREAGLPDTVGHALLHVTGPVLPAPAVDLAALRQQMLAQAEAVRGIFLRRIGPMGDGA